MNDDLDAVAALHDPVRRALYEFVAAQGRPVGREEAGQAAGISRTLAAFHLDKLAEAGLLEIDFMRLTDAKPGPGGGRPAKVYRRARTARKVTLPERDYEQLAGLLAEVVHDLDADDRAIAAAGAAGRRLHQPGAWHQTLRDRGYEPYADGDRVRLRNCPFHQVARDQPLLVCAMNLALCQGLAGADATAELDPRPDECCVSFSKNKNC
ncbi:helix-turn-helix transcriptional regulator [Catellatospora tritici]|uniref:helix-turn-helix transcriptional regulator n=1 Tax=Catellatospora tritici TaxID=2851566 RepID=UPI001C2D3C1D|nr:transcriptional regulator [Catellatospora tritici]MBV1850743.1 transcriptional regulator [Catellatospora tritici]MBV1850996.1 transcriptional regulator [Catellatospora tritici]